LKEERPEDKLMQMLRMVAPGTSLREGLENILRAGTGGLVVIGDGQEISGITEGGFVVNAEFNPASLYELAKMDGAIILSSDTKRIIAANTFLIPDLNIPSSETGIRHRTAERVAKQTGALIIAISQRRNVITIYRGSIKYMLRDTGVILTKANQALQTLEKYRTTLDKVIENLSILEYEDAVTLFDVTKSLQRVEMVLRVVQEIERYICELGTEGRLITMQLEELVTNVENDVLLIIRDYALVASDKSPTHILAVINSWPAEDLLDLTLLARALGYSGSTSILDQPVSPRGYRILSKIPRLPFLVVENVIKEFGSLKRILNASIQELDTVEGIGEIRARSIKEGLARYQEQLFQNRFA
jgi:diadenylate cyclase